jgi:hypothetical protein
MHCAIDIAVIGHSHRSLAYFRNPADKLFNVASAIQERVIGMEMKMDEF